MGSPHRDRNICSATSEPGSRVTSSSDSPHVPPPPPPRHDSLKSPKLSHDYIDPYDSIPGSIGGVVPDPVYHEPVNCVFTEHSKNELRKMTNEGKDDSDNVFSESGNTRKLEIEDIESLYAKPMKKKKTDHVEHQTVMQNDGCLYAEIMEHINSKSEQSSSETFKKRNRDYATIDECMMSPSSDCTRPSEDVPSNTEVNSTVKYSVDGKTSCPKFATISKSKKLTVMAASTEKIYETYLSYGKKTEMQRYRKEIKSAGSLKPLTQRCKSQPDVFSGEGLKVFEENINQNISSNKQEITFSSFKPVELTDKDCRGIPNKQSSVDNLRNCGLPGTPVIMATPSFDSLCSASNSSGSPRSVQDKSMSVSAESLSSKSNHSELTTSSLSMSPDPAIDRLPPLPPKKPEYKPTENTNTIYNQTGESANSGNNYQTPAKRTTLKNGIDLSVYLLKPKEDSAEKASKTKAACSSKDKEKAVNKPVMLTFKESLSGVKTNGLATPAPQVNHIAQSDKHAPVPAVPEHKPVIPSKPPQIPSIGITAKARTISRQKEPVVMEKRDHSNKREFDELDRGDNRYLETDIDTISSEAEKQPLKKSKSLGRFEPGSSTVITEIW